MLTLILQVIGIVLLTIRAFTLAPPPPPRIDFGWLGLALFFLGSILPAVTR